MIAKPGYHNLEKSFLRISPFLFRWQQEQVKLSQPLLRIPIAAFCQEQENSFLVDTKNLGEQAEEEFRKYNPMMMYAISELYNVRRLVLLIYPRIHMYV